jgi:peptidyl-dipeptidase Dcp
VVRGSRGGEFDNRASWPRCSSCAPKRAQLLGYANHAAYVLEDETAKTPEAVNSMLARLAPAAVANARREAADMQAMIVDAAKGEPGFQLEPGTGRTTPRRCARPSTTSTSRSCKPYFELKNVLVNGVFFAATELYGITFKPRPDLPSYHPDVKSGTCSTPTAARCAIFIVDMYARPSKRGGAWMNSYVAQSDLLGEKPVVANHLNIPKPPEGQPTLLTWDEANTMFHEFGHALHGCSRT